MLVFFKSQDRFLIAQSGEGLPGLCEGLKVSDFGDCGQRQNFRRLRIVLSWCLRPTMPTQGDLQYPPPSEVGYVAPPEQFALVAHRRDTEIMDLPL